MHDPDDDAPGSSDDWEFTPMSPSISSLSSFAPEEYSLPLHQHLAEPSTRYLPAQLSPPQTSPRRRQPPPSQHQQQSRIPTFNHGAQSESPSLDRFRQKQRTPPQKHPVRTPTAITTTHPPNGMSIPYLHTPPPTSPRRKPGNLLFANPSSVATRTTITSPSAPDAQLTPRGPTTATSSFSSSTTANSTTNTNHNTAATPGPTSPTKPPSHASFTSGSSNNNSLINININRSTSNLSRASTRSGAPLPGGLRLHMGTGTGVGVGLGSGLPVSPLPTPASASSWLHRGALPGPRFVSGVGVEERSGFSPLKAGSMDVLGGSDEDERRRSLDQSLNLSLSLSQGWSDLGAAQEAEEEGPGSSVGNEEGSSSVGNSQRNSWDSVATVREEPGRGHDYYDYEVEGSNTHIGDGSDGYMYKDRDYLLRQYATSPERSASSRGYTTDSRAYDLGESRGHTPNHLDRPQDSSSPTYADGWLKPEKTTGGVRFLEIQKEAASQHNIDVKDMQEPEPTGKWDRGLERILEETQETETAGDTLPPGRVMLMERLCDMVQKLSSVRVGGGMEADVIDVLNAKVEEMEDLLVLAEETAEAEAGADGSEGGEDDGREKEEVEEEGGEEEGGEEEGGEEEGREDDDTKAEAEAEELSEIKLPHQNDQPEGETEEAPKETETSANEPDSKEDDDETSPPLQLSPPDIRDLTTPLPWLTSTFKFSESLDVSPTRSNPELAAATNEALEAAKQAAQAQADMAERVAREAERLNGELVRVVKGLRARREESDHLHSLLINRAESAATRILDLEQEICDLEDDILSGESELRHLRLKLRAVEALCHDLLVPHSGTDPELIRCIDNWKADWVLVRDRMLARKRGRTERRARLCRKGCVISSLEERESRETETETMTSLGGLSMSVSMMGLGGTGPRH
ncbi:uncharacterized protein C8A04DRAFT_9734 [Dichotomopilus funicola]|uniref:Uncharacterized protein n=1 Tax=Dichotomopilus funicola TaxID=1934379 RepID=A0AAN6ZQN2_9PEZI|nr:hypothetical protein C8A04DRAFT_9734 [Dichotomopilus funicola]